MTKQPNNVPTTIGIPSGAPQDVQAVAAFLTQLVPALNNWIAQAATAINALLAEEAKE